MGDPAGIGLEIALMAWRDRSAAAIPPFALFADPDAIAAPRAAPCVSKYAIETVDSLADAAASFCRPPSGPAQCVSASPVSAGRPDSANAARRHSVDRARADTAVVEGEAARRVTNPIAKSVLYGAGFAHPGHTEFLASLAEAREPGRRYHPVMMLASDELRVVPLTVHIPLADVAKSITASGDPGHGRAFCGDALRRDFGFDAPRIAVAGLNPHAGEDGTLGREEEDVIAPAIARLACRRARRHRPAFGRHAVSCRSAHALRRGARHVSRPGADPAEDAGLRSRRQRHARPAVRAHVARSWHRLSISPAPVWRSPTASSPA